MACFADYNLRAWSFCLIISSIWLTSCGGLSSNPPSVDTSCQPNMVLIEVGDGYFRRQCGCTETLGVAFFAADFTCTTSSKTPTILFTFPGTYLAHRIVPDGTPSLGSSPWVDPTLVGTPSIRSWPASAKSSGTYKFKDVHNPKMIGTITIP